MSWLEHFLNKPIHRSPFLTVTGGKNRGKYIRPLNNCVTSRILRIGVKYRLRSSSSRKRSSWKTMRTISPMQKK